MADARLPELLTTNPDVVANAIIERHGGMGALSAMDLEVVYAMVRTVRAMREADVEALPRLVDSLSKLEGMLPSVVGAQRTPLERLRDHCAGSTSPGAPERMDGQNGVREGAS